MIGVRFLKGLVLVAFIAALTWIAMQALENTFSKGLLRSEASRAPDLRGPLCESAGTVYARWRKAADDNGAVGMTLDALWGGPGWRETAPTCPDTATAQWWIETFGRLNDTLYMLIETPTIDVQADGLDTVLLPEGIMKATTFKSLPLFVQRWIAQERTKRQLVDVVGLLIVIAQLGSLIYLISGYLSSTEAPTIRDILFRPLLAALLAIGVFVANIGLLGVISRGSVFDVKTEPLYLLALGAGLATDAVYKYLRDKVEQTAAQDRLSEKRIEAHAKRLAGTTAAAEAN